MEWFIMDGFYIRMEKYVIFSGKFHQKAKIEGLEGLMTKGFVGRRVFPDFVLGLVKSKDIGLPHFLLRLVGTRVFQDFVLVDQI